MAMTADEKINGHNEACKQNQAAFTAPAGCRVPAVP
jgi:hypothetical protein